MAETVSDTVRLTPRDYEVLDDLRSAVATMVQYGHSEWVRPLDCGGMNGSDHSYRLAKLARLGLANQRQRSSWTGRRGSKSYTITPAGLAALESNSHE